MAPRAQAERWEMQVMTPLCHSHRLFPGVRGRIRRKLMKLRSH